MARAIDADAFREWWLENGENEYVYDTNAFLGSIDNWPTLTPPNEWVSVEERLPEESDGMVLFTNGRAVTSGYRNHMFRMSDEEGVYAPAIRKGGGYMRVTHWMHLPAPPDRRPRTLRIRTTTVNCRFKGGLTYEPEEKSPPPVGAGHRPDPVQSAEAGRHGRESECRSGGGQAHPGEDAGAEGSAERWQG